MALSEQREDVELLDESSLGVDHTSATRDSAQRLLEVAKGRERHLVHQVELLEERLLETETKLAEMQQEVERAMDLVGAIQRTTSWRVTAPLRTARRLLGRS
jgi:hypothetical protein